MITASRALQAILSEIKQLQTTLGKSVPFAAAELVDVTFNATANADTEIPHRMVTPLPELVRYIPVTWWFETPPATIPLVYRDASTTRRAWGRSYIVLRCTIASARARLLLFTEVLK